MTPAGEGPSPTSDGPDLSDRQRAILWHRAQGLTGPQIARTEHISVSTLAYHEQVITLRLGARNITHAVHLATSQRLFTSTPQSSSDSDHLGDLGVRIRIERDSRGWTSLDLAQRSGLGESTVKYIEGGRSNVYVTSLRRIADALGTSVGQLLSDEWRPPAPQREVLVLSDRQAQALWLTLVEGMTLQQAATVAHASREVMGSRLTHAYRALGVGHLPQAERRVEALRVAGEHGLIPGNPYVA
ncbi:LuxR C-terminal-related transcriptional regulator [Streptomyces sp. 8L]|uniref:LuxR C-terminal-related transcriptional regulator n=1 Tax=Streptomyces sp. 8L TaxID=2877242 RepID=UPI001CD2A386|nr:LuxR C-terminal-related transcriptional regulator [Streptomyces sp. 8L]MCA1224103.1 LuxR C-terminal-related transcriptional regulator [Streptomyces sp. 8L]